MKHKELKNFSHNTLGYYSTKLWTDIQLYFELFWNFEVCHISKKQNTSKISIKILIVNNLRLTERHLKQILLF